MGKPQKRLAVLIDADNSQAAIIEGLLTEIAKFGVASVKRIYGDWTDVRLKKWKATLLDYGLTPIQQFAYTQGKNATDSAMIIDAMDLLYTKNFDGFCIISSDSDFTKLASRIREEGLLAYGFGEKKTPKSFVAAVDKFVYTENLRDCAKSGDCVDNTGTNDLKMDKKLLGQLRIAVESSVDESTWANLGAIGQHLANTTPDFDPRNYGFKKLSDLLLATEEYEVKSRFNDEYSSAKSYYVRPKQRRKR